MQLIIMRHGEAAYIQPDGEVSRRTEVVYSSESGSWDALKKAKQASEAAVTGALKIPWFRKARYAKARRHWDRGSVEPDVFEAPLHAAMAAKGELCKAAEMPMTETKASYVW